MAERSRERSCVLLSCLIHQTKLLNIIQKEPLCKDQITWKSGWIFCLFPNFDFQTIFLVSEGVSFFTCHNHSFIFYNAAQEKANRKN